MPTLATDLRTLLEKVIIKARDISEIAAKAALEALAVQYHEAYRHMTPEQRELRNQLRARARQAGDLQDIKGQLSINHVIHECAYEQWHRMLFARFLSENNLLIEPESGVAISLEECKELAKTEKIDLWTLAGQYAQKMLPEVFRADDPLLKVGLAREDQLKLELLLDSLPANVFAASDSLGWCYQFWQTKRKDEVNASGKKIGADELPAVTQLFTEDYMVDFLLDNTLGAWWAGKLLLANPMLAGSANTEMELRQAIALRGAPWAYLRFVKGKDGNWLPAAGAFEGWPKAAKELKCLDPCMGSGHFIVAMFERLVAIRMSNEKLSEAAAVEAVIRENLFGLEIDPRCTQIAAFNLALAAWRRIGYRLLPIMHLACSGSGITARREEWTELTPGKSHHRFQMGALYDLFQKAPFLGSLISPSRDKAVTFGISLRELRPLLDAVIEREKSDEVHELAVKAQGIAKAAEILTTQFTLVTTNVPYLKSRKQAEHLKAYCETFYPKSKADIATVFVERLLEHCAPFGTIALVTPQHWRFLGSYKNLRVHLLNTRKLHLLGALGPGAFETISGEVVSVMLIALSATTPEHCHSLATIDATGEQTPSAKAKVLLEVTPILADQKSLLESPDARLTFGANESGELLLQYATCLAGIQNGDSPKFQRKFWEVSAFGEFWHFEQGTVEQTTLFGGRELIIFYDREEGHLREDAYIRRTKLHDSDQRGNQAWGKPGIVVSQMGELPVTLYSGDLYDQSCAVILPQTRNMTPAIWAFCSSEEFLESVREIDQSIKVTPNTLVKIPFQTTYWQKVAAENYPNGLPRPHSDDLTQWLFDGHARASEHPMHVAAARLLGYKWPRQSGSSFLDCPSLDPDGLEKLEDENGIVCIPSVRGEEPAADRLRMMLAAAYGKDWKHTTETELLRAAGSECSDLDEWLRNDFFAQHCEIFHQRPFIWHIWDGRKRDGFHVLINYHKLAEANGRGRRTLESLTHSYLNDWILRQKDGVKRGTEGAEDRLAAALELKKRLEAILEGEPPYDIFVRWKSLAQQAIGWEPDINDGVRMNIRPFMVSDLPGGKRGAGILRFKPNIKWEKDRGEETQRPKADYSWFWNGNEFIGDRINDVHLSNEEKRKAREKK